MKEKLTPNRIRTIETSPLATRYTEAEKLAEKLRGHLTPEKIKELETRKDDIMTLLTELDSADLITTEFIPNEAEPEYLSVSDKDGHEFLRIHFGPNGETEIVESKPN